MDARVSNSEIANAEVRELARRSADGIDVALLWDSGANRVFVAVDDEGRGERFRIAIGNRSALEAFHHPYAYAADALPAGGLQRGGRHSHTEKGATMHLHLVRAAALSAAPQTDVTQRPAKIVALEARRQARLQATTARPPLRAA